MPVPNWPFPFCLSACGGFRGNRAPCAACAPCASVRPLGVHEYAVGSQSCAIRRKRLWCARLRPRSPPRMARFGVRRVAPSCLTALSVLAAVRRRSPPARFAAACGAMPRRGIPLLASRSHALPSRANRLAPSLSARSVPRRPAPHLPKRRVSLRFLCGAASHRLSGPPISPLRSLRSLRLKTPSSSILSTAVPT